MDTTAELGNPSLLPSIEIGSSTRSLCSLDFETRSRIDLKKTGAYVYASHPSTEVSCLSLYTPAGVCYDWLLGEPLPYRVIEYVRYGGLISAWNAAFEYYIWNLTFKRMFPEIPPLPWSQLFDTASDALAMNLPEKLDNAGEAVNSEYKKDKEGHALMLKLCKPAKSGSFIDDPVSQVRQLMYCRQDTKTEYSIAKYVPPLSKKERRIFLKDQEINRKGILVDTEFCRAASAYVEKYKGILAEKCKSEFGVAPTQRDKVLQLVRSMGATLPNMQAATIDAYLNTKLDYVDTADISPFDESFTKIYAQQNNISRLPSDKAEVVKRLLNYRRESAMNSVKKYDTILGAVDSKSVLRGMFRYCGAMQTGRWAGRIVQMHNLKRPTVKHDTVLEIIKRIKAGAPIDEFGNPLELLASCVRSAFIARPGNKFIISDYSSIEARVLAWLAGEISVLKFFSDSDRGKVDKDIYERAAVNMESFLGFLPERQVGKVAVLALGYQGGVGAFQQMAKGYKVVLKDAEADQIKDAWRQAHPAIVRFWYQLQETMLRVIQRPGTVEKVGMLVFKVHKKIMYCRLPSGRCLVYPLPRIEYKPAPWDAKMDIPVVTFQGVGKSGKAVRIETYGGKVCENATQGVARDILAEAMLKLNNVVIHVHDENVVEDKPAYKANVHQKMIEGSAWMQGLPLAAKTEISTRYKK